MTSVEDHRVVDVLPTRDAGPLAVWLVRHTGVEIICRDRAGAYAEGARRGAPDALQVADRFHLWQGLGRAVETCVAAHRDCLRTPTPSGLLPKGTRPASDRPQSDAEPVGRRAERKKAAHALVHEMLAQGQSRRAIARHRGWGLNTVLQYANAAQWQDTIRDIQPRPSRLDLYKPYLERRFAEGSTGVTQLHGELVSEQAPITHGMVRAHIATLRGAPSTATPRPPTVRQVTGWPTRHPTALSEEDRVTLKDLLTRCPELVTAAGHVRDFGEILTGRLGATLPAWIDAVTAGLLDWSSGSIEGAMNRIKKIKRQLSGRAGFELLHKMILLQQCVARVPVRRFPARDFTNTTCPPATTSPPPSCPTAGPRHSTPPSSPPPTCGTPSGHTRPPRPYLDP
ncbi:transposase [Streptomyces sp. NPDC090077]|uniref:transposase n=1 Tax=Streptomyces sp. NPDC090077 TaxID=3365938 RepID=UPI00380E08C6